MRVLSAYFFLTLCFGVTQGFESTTASAQSLQKQSHRDAILKKDAVVEAATVGDKELLGPPDRVRFKKFFTDVDAGRVSKACANTRHITHEIARELTTWVCLDKGSNPSSFETHAEFASSHLHWPWLKQLRRKTEARLTGQTPDSEIISWFDNQPPLTGRGAAAYAGALKRAGRDDELQALVAVSWVALDFGRVESMDFHRRYKSMITPEMNQSRLERLLWERKYTSASRQARLVPDDQRRLAEARIALGKGLAGVDAAIGRVPAQLKEDPGLLYERARWRWRKGRRDAVVELIDKAGPSVPRPELWWSMRHSLARSALSKGNIEQAYRISSNHGMSNGIGFAEGEWLAGWISLRFLKQPRRGYEHFARLYYGVESPISQARGAYWAGEAARTMGNEKWSQRWYKIAAGHRTTFYGQLAAHRLGRQINLPINPYQPPTDAERQAFEKQDLVTVVKLLSLVDQPRYQDAFLSRLRLNAKSSADYILTAELAREQSRLGSALKVAKRAQRNSITLLEHLYPSIETGKTEPETALILALIRQESAFDTQAKSHAGARGLMQLMPATAKEVARSQRKKFSKDRLISDPQYNLSLGQAYLSQVLDRFNGSYILALAAYNAGPHRARTWIREFGDPRDPGIDPIDWIEQIPFSETRNYVQRILESLSVYRLILADGRAAPSASPHSTGNPFVSWGHQTPSDPCCF